MLKKITFTDKVLAGSLLRIIPSFVVPNYITFFRLLATPIVIILILKENYLFAFILFMAGILSDAIDGSLARTRNEITKQGKIIDPLADKILIGSTTIILVTKYINFYLAAGIIALETVLAIGGLSRYPKNKNVEANIWGKIKMILQSIGISSIFLYILTQSYFILQLAGLSLFASLFFAAVSLLVYKSI